jgi:hypothetical protein
MAPASDDPVFAAIAEHKRLRSFAYHGGFDELDEGPEFEAACDDEERAIQALGSLKPTTVAGAAALLAYMARVEGFFVKNTGSPLLKTVKTVAKALKTIEPREA